MALAARVRLCTLQVPFIGWTAAVPVVGSTINRALQSIAKPVASTFLLNSGKQFFLEDATDSGQEPLLVRQVAHLLP